VIDTAIQTANSNEILIDLTGSTNLTNPTSDEEMLMTSLINMILPTSNNNRNHHRHGGRGRGHRIRNSLGARTRSATYTNTSLGHNTNTNTSTSLGHNTSTSLDEVIRINREIVKQNNS
jgi:hypothetical protein